MSSAKSEDGLVDFVTIEDSLGMQSSRYDGPDARSDQVRGRLDAVSVAARVAPLTTHVGLVPTITTTHTEPFHVSKAIATLDYVSTGRAGLRAQLSRPWDNTHFGRRPADPLRLEAATPGRASGARRPLRRGRRLRRGRAAAVGLVGGRRRDPRRGDEPVHRPRQAPPHRLRRALVQRAWPVDHTTPAAGATARHRARRTPPSRTGSALAAPTSCSSTPNDADHAAAIVAEVRAEQAVAGRGDELRARLRRSRRRARRDHRCRRRTPGAARRRCRCATAQRRRDRRRGRRSTSPTGCSSCSRSASPDSGCGRRPSPTTSHAIARLLVPELQRRGAFRTASGRGDAPRTPRAARPASRYATARPEHR